MQQVPAASAVAVPQVPVEFLKLAVREQAKALAVRAAQLGMLMHVILDGEVFDGDALLRDVLPQPGESKLDLPRRSATRDVSDFPWARDLAEELAKIRSGPRAGAVDPERLPKITGLMKMCQIRDGMLIFNVDRYSVNPVQLEALIGSVNRFRGEQIVNELVAGVLDRVDGRKRKRDRKATLLADADVLKTRCRIESERSLDAREISSLCNSRFGRAMRVISAPIRKGAPPRLGTRFAWVPLPETTYSVALELRLDAGDARKLFLVRDAIELRLRTADVGLAASCGFYANEGIGRGVEHRVLIDFMAVTIEDTGERTTWKALRGRFEGHGPEAPARVHEAAGAQPDEPREEPAFDRATGTLTANLAALRWLDDEPARLLAYPGLYRVRIDVPRSPAEQPEWFRLGARVGEALARMSVTKPYRIWPGDDTAERALTFAFQDSTVECALPRCELAGIRLEVLVPGGADATIHGPQWLEIRVVRELASADGGCIVLKHAGLDFDAVPVAVSKYDSIPAVMRGLLEGDRSRKEHRKDAKDAEALVSGHLLPELAGIVGSYAAESDGSNAVEQVRRVLEAPYFDRVLPKSWNALRRDSGNLIDILRAELLDRPARVPAFLRLLEGNPDKLTLAALLAKSARTSRFAQPIPEYRDDRCVALLAVIPFLEEASPPSP